MMARRFEVGFGGCEGEGEVAEEEGGAAEVEVGDEEGEGDKSWHAGLSEDGPKNTPIAQICDAGRERLFCGGAPAGEKEERGSEDGSGRKVPAVRYGECERGFYGEADLRARP